MSVVEIYSDSADLYDEVELRGRGSSITTNERIIRWFDRSSVRDVLDLSCGTGAQSISLAERGYSVLANDLNKDMIEVARVKAGELDIKFHVGDMKTLSLGRFDAVISMFNSVGHLSKTELYETLVNARNNIHDGGILIFDIFNRDVMPLLPKYRFIDQAAERSGHFYVRYTQFQFDKSTGVLNTKQTVMLQDGLSEIRQIDKEYDLQTYKRNELSSMLVEAGFEVEEISEHGLSDYVSFESPVVSMLMHFVVARSRS